MSYGLYVKIDFIQKAHLMAGRNCIDPPSSHTYSSVVAHDSVHIAFLIAALNDLDILIACIGNAYLNAYTKEIVHTLYREWSKHSGMLHHNCVCLIWS